uniref:Uncharacterized protein n=1 Tax=Pelusios castaneus TaxID=367368 RepID=A0A8C8SAN8_9SAUR
MNPPLLAPACLQASTCNSFWRLWWDFRGFKQPGLDPSEGQGSHCFDAHARTGFLLEGLVAYDCPAQRALRCKAALVSGESQAEGRATVWNQSSLQVGPVHLVVSPFPWGHPGVVSGMGQGQGKGSGYCTPLECILLNWKQLGSDPMTKIQVERFCSVDWPQYQLGDQEQWPQGGSLNYNTILQLLLFCQRTGKWNEHMYAQLFMALRDRTELLRKCGLVATGSETFSPLPPPPPLVMAEPEPPSAPIPPPARDEGPGVQEAGGALGMYPLITESAISRQGGDNRPATTMQVYTHVPFNPVDLAAFEAQAEDFSTNPSRFMSVFEGCLVSHKPDWDDCNWGNWERSQVPCLCPRRMYLGRQTYFPSHSIPP